MKIMKKQRGFALLEVLIAALIMTIGGIAYMRLQQTGLRYSYNNYVRTQGMVIAENFVDTLRNNIDYFEKASECKGKTDEVCGVMTVTHKPEEVIQSSVFDEKICANVIMKEVTSDGKEKESTRFQCNPELAFKLQNEFVGKQLQNSVSNSVICYRVRQDGLARITFMWKDNSEASRNIDVAKLMKKEIADNYCPKAFDDDKFDDSLKQNMVSIYAQL